MRIISLLFDELSTEGDSISGRIWFKGSRILRHRRIRLWRKGVKRKLNILMNYYRVHKIVCFWERVK